METVTHDQDFSEWAKRNAELIRQGRLSEIDAEHIAEELENMGKSQRRELVSRLAVLLAHLLKWRYQPDGRTNSWVGTIVTQRTEILLLLEESPSLKHDMDSSIEKAYRFARDRAAREMGVGRNTFLESCPYSFDQIVDEDFWPV
ncbi:MAG: DUF29 domain-containing protein [Pseudomonadota bacterium]